MAERSSTHFLTPILHIVGSADRRGTGRAARSGTVDPPRRRGGPMFEWSDEQVMLRDAVRQFIEKEIVPTHEELKHGGRPPYDVLRKLFATFGMDVMAREGFKKRIEFEKRVED